MPDGADRPASAEAQVGDAGASPHALLQVWLSPVFPVGAFAYSHGLEKAAEFGWIKDRATLEAWLADLVADGGLRNDLIFLASAWQAVSQRDDAGLTEVAELALAFQPSAERYLETTQQGRSFLGQIDAAWPTPVLVRLKSAHGREIAYPIALGLATAAHDVPLADALRAYALAFTSNLVSAAIRLSVDVSAGIVLEPANFFFGPVLVGASPRVPIVAKWREGAGKAFKILSVEAAGLPDATFETKAFDAPPWHGTTVTLGFMKPPAAGTILGSVLIRTDDPERPSIQARAARAPLARAMNRMPPRVGSASGSGRARD